MTATIAAVAALAGMAACGDAQRAAAPEPEIVAQLERIQREHDPPPYYLGLSFAGLPLTHADVSPHGALFIYGECRGEGQGDNFHCTGPQIQLQQTAIASPARYETPWRGCVRTTVRGVPAGQFDGFEVYTGDVLVKIYARDFGDAKEAAAALRPIGDPEPRGPLPPPSIDVEQPLRECALESLDAKLAELRREAKGPLYWVGREFDGHPIRRAEGDGRWARFLYGDCVRLVPRDNDCWAPLTVEQRPLGDFRPAGWAPGIECSASRIRGASAALTPGAHGLVLFTGDVSVHLISEDLDLLRRAADAIRRLDEPSATATLPAPPESLVQELRRTCTA